MEIQANIDSNSNSENSFKKVGIILKIATLAVAFLAIAMMSL